jgi:hypothetical protein
MAAQQYPVDLAATMSILAIVSWYLRMIFDVVRRMIIKPLVLLAILACANSPLLAADATEQDIKQIFSATDCNSVLQNRSFGLQLLGRNFPMSQGYAFYGMDRGSAVFRISSAPDPADHIREYSSPELAHEALELWLASRA